MTHDDNQYLEPKFIDRDGAPAWRAIRNARRLTDRPLRELSAARIDALEGCFFDGEPVSADAARALREINGERAHRLADICARSRAVC